MFSTLSGPRRILYWASKFVRKLLKGNLGWETALYASCDMKPLCMLPAA